MIYFTWCGPVRGIRESGDLTVGYSAGQAWLAGEDPYQPAMLMKHLAQAGAQEFATPDYVGFMRNIYLPTTLPLYSPVGVFPWTVARSVWVGLGTVSLLVCVAGIMQLAGVRWGSTPGLGLMALSLALAPVHTAFGLGQVSVIALGSLMAAVMLEQRGRAGWAGLFYGLATIAKVQIGLPFVLYVLWRQRWRAGIIALALVAGVTLLSVARMEVAGVPWFASLQDNLRFTFTDRGYNDAIRGSAGRYTLVNLAYLLHVFTDSRLLVGLASYGLVGAAGLAVLARIHGKGYSQELLGCSLIATLCLLVTYHRTYDAVLMLIPAGWALAGLGAGDGGKGIHWAVLACCASFVFPGQVLFQHLAARGIISASLAGSTFWQATVLCQHVWGNPDLCGVTALVRLAILPSPDIWHLIPYSFVYGGLHHCSRPAKAMGCH